jgi:hypothetical protein
MAQMTVRVNQAVLDYREAVYEKTGRKKRFFDQEVYDFYIKHHPLDPDTEQKDDHE